MIVNIFIDIEPAEMIKGLEVLKLVRHIRFVINWDEMCTPDNVVDGYNRTNRS